MTTNVAVSHTIVHLITQRDQPYGSVRRCCERCGVSFLPAPAGHKYSDEHSFYNNLPEGYVTCEKAGYGPSKPK